jgi:hypothetical protein
MEIRNCIIDDTTDILLLYEAARNLQTQKQMVVWPSFERSFIENEINEERQWKIVIQKVIACNWAVTFKDKEIWVKDIRMMQFIFIAFAQNRSYGETGTLI